MTGTTSGEITVGLLPASPGKSGCTYGATIRWKDGKVSSVLCTGRVDDAKTNKGLLALPALVTCLVSGFAGKATVASMQVAFQRLAARDVCAIYHNVTKRDEDLKET
jgi:hypothetical protein